MLARRAPQQLRDSIAKSLADDFSRRILASATGEAKTIHEISREQGIPLSTSYRRIKQLVNRGVVLVDHIVVTGKGKKYTTYRSAFKSLTIQLDESGIISTNVTPNPDMADKLHDMLLAMRWT